MFFISPDIIKLYINADVTELHQNFILVQNQQMSQKQAISFSIQGQVEEPTVDTSPDGLIKRWVVKFFLGLEIN